MLFVPDGKTPDPMNAAKTLQPWPLALVLAMALCACGQDNTADNESDDHPSENYSPVAEGTAARHLQPGDASSVQGGQPTVSMQCLRSMNESGWRQLGLNDDQMARVKGLQERMGPSTGTVNTHGDSTTNSGVQGGSSTSSGSQATDASPGMSSVMGGTTDAEGKSNSGEVIDQPTLTGLSSILSSEQLAQLERMCSGGAASAMQGNK